MRFCLREFALDKEPRVGVMPELPNMRSLNQSLATAELVSAHGNRKLDLLQNCHGAISML